MLNDEVKKKILAILEEETARMQFGKIIFEVTIHNSRITNVQAETKRSHNINESEIIVAKRSQTSFQRAG